VSEILVRAEGLRKVFGKEMVAVDDVSFTVERGQSLAVVGESGSGKTTVARMLLGLETPTSGTISVCGRTRSGRANSAERRRRAREIQIVFQDPYSSLDPLQRVGDIVETSLAVHNRLTANERRTRALDLLEAVGLAERHAGMLPRQLSGGQRQRVAIARAVAVEPQVLVLDEAVAALDVSIQAQILNLLADIRERTGISYVFISHDLAVVNQISDTALVMAAGRVVERGPTAQLLSAPQQDYTKALLAAVPRPGWKPQRRAAAAGRPQG
jgi:ABC-type glutathione transport system ATPase component